MNRRLLIVLVLLLVGGCVYVGRHGSYNRSDTIAGTNVRAVKVEVKP